jgi:hypothetical protein
MASVRGILNIQSLNELTYEKRYKCTTGTAIDRQQTMHRPLSHVTHHVYAANWRALLTYLPHAVTRH